MKKTDEIKHLFKLYLEGRTSPMQEELLFAHLNNDEIKDEDLFEEMEQRWKNESAFVADPEAVTLGLDQIWSRLDIKKRSQSRSYLLRYVASVILVITAGLGWYKYQNNSSEVVLVTEFITKTTRPGEKLKLILPDSSVVYLGGGSKFSWPRHFVRGSERNVRLDGEAFFEVKRDPEHPFIVQTSRLRTQVLGTSFNVYAYPSDKLFSVTVRTGKVAVAETIEGRQRELSLLTPGMKLIYKEKNGKYVINSAHIEEIDSWVMNKFVFRDESLSGMLARLQRYYHVDFKVKGIKSNAYQFSVTFSNKSIKDVMEQLRIMSGNHLQYEISKDNMKITIWEGARK